MKHGLATVALLVLAAWTFAPRPAYPHNPTTTTVLFNREITALLQRKCVQCHAPGKMAMPLVTYAQTRPWAEAIKEEALARRMPPWPAERGFGVFSNDIGLTPREFEFLISWIDGGVPEGTGAPPALVDHGSHWMLGDPDLVVSPSAAAVVDGGSASAFRRVIIDTGLTHDVSLRAFDFQPDPRVTRAAFLTIAGTGEYLGGWTPWQSVTELPAGTALRLPAHARIAVDVMYAGAAESVRDTPRLGLYVSSSASAAIVVTSTLRPATPVAASSDRIVAELTMPQRRALISLRPEMQPGARSLEIKVVRPDGSREVLLWLKHFQQDWQTPYVFRTPVTLPAGSLIQATAYFDHPPAASGMAPFTIALNHYAQK